MGRSLLLHVDVAAGSRLEGSLDLGLPKLPEVLALAHKPDAHIVLRQLRLLGTRLQGLQRVAHELVSTQGGKRLVVPLEVGLG